MRLDDPEALRGRRALVIEDGPTTTHGGMPYGAGYVAAMQGGALDIVDPRPFAEPEIAAVYARYPHIGPVLPALGYSKPQIDALRATILRCDAAAVVSATPFDLAALIGAAKPMVRARYEFAEAGEPGLGQAIDAFLAVRTPGR